MRVIDLDQLQISEDWQRRANLAIHADRANIGNLWQELKEPLKTLSHGKCYYCETIQERSDGAVDHFRPKKKYPWSAYSHTNYRFACTYCNSRRRDERGNKTGGKGDNFPLFDESRRAQCCADEANESPILIDPCNPAEPGLLDFDESGWPRPAYSKDTHEAKFTRAETSINLYHLDHSDLVDRRKVLAITIARQIRAADLLFPRTEAGDLAIDTAFSQYVRYLAACVSEKAELSAFSRRILSGYRNILWVDNLLRSA